MKLHLTLLVVVTVMLASCTGPQCLSMQCIRKTDNPAYGTGFWDSPNYSSS